MCSCVGWMGEEIGLHAVCDWSYLKSQSVTTHSLHVLQWCCQLYTTSYRGRHCIWWVQMCVRTCACVCKIPFLFQNQSLISLLNFFNWFKSFSISTIPVTHHQNFKKNCSLTCLILYNRCQMLTCWLYRLYQQVCVCVCVYGIHIYRWVHWWSWAESWAHDPEDTGSDPRAGG